MPAYVQTFDGLEGASAPCDAPPCPTCGAGRTLELWSFVARARSGSSLSDPEVAGLGLHRVAVSGLGVTTVGPGQPFAYVGDLRCAACGASSPVVVGLRELQPGRWTGGVVR